MEMDDISVGTDVVDVDRIENAIKKFGKKFLNRTFFEEEIEYCQKSRNPAERFAARFAAKEALSKAIGNGPWNGLRCKDIAVLKKPSGEPYFKFSERLLEFMRSRGIRGAKLSMAHTKTLAQAVVILIK